MTLRQLEYITAVDKFRNFARAAEFCGVTQPTLSKMVAELEDELDVRIFDRTNRRVEPTATGRRIIGQAVTVMTEAGRIREIADETRNSLSGKLRLSVGPSIAPYILPEFIRVYSADNPGVSLTVEELRPQNMLDSLLSGEIDMAVAVSGKSTGEIFEIPLYIEPFFVYLSESCLRRDQVFTPAQLSHENMWVMKEAQCIRESAFSFCKARKTGHRIYEAGNIETLVRVVDANGGFTIIPEMHLPLLSAHQRRNVRPLDGDSRSMRRVSLYIRHDYVRQKMLNSIVGVIKKVVPARMLDPFILNQEVRL